MAREELTLLSVLTSWTNVVHLWFNGPTIGYGSSPDLVDEPKSSVSELVHPFHIVETLIGHLHDDFPWHC